MKKTAQQLESMGYLRIRWVGTPAVLRSLGVRIIDDTGAPRDKEWKRIPGQPKKILWAPRWAVLLAEAEPCSEAARTWAMGRAAVDEEFRKALEAFVALMPDNRPHQQMADYLVELWEPEEGR